MKIYHPPCPACQSTNTHIDSHTSKSVAFWTRVALHGFLFFLPIIRVKMRCQDCEKPFLAVGNRSFHSKWI